MLENMICEGLGGIAGGSGRCDDDDDHDDDDGNNHHDDDADDDNCCGDQFIHARHAAATAFQSAIVHV